MTYKELSDLVYNNGMPSHSQVYVCDNNGKKYEIKNMTNWGFDNKETRFGIIEIEEITKE